MRLRPFLIFNGILFTAAGIAFGLYGPLMMAFFNVPELQDLSGLAYWHLAAFARMFGAGLFGWGLLLWGLSRGVEALPAATRRGLVFAQLLSCLMGAFISLTQQSAIWMTPAGWALSGIFILLAVAYIYFLLKERAE